jgi:WD40 repeat protein/serine/threonine protein kinase
VADCSSDREPLEQLAESFLARFRAGEQPSLTEFAAAHPELADQIRELFPALVEMEQAGSEIDEATGAALLQAALGGSRLESLGDYRIIREIGRGGMGVVYEAEQVSLGRRVALKVLPRQVAQDPKTLARFRREARSAAQLHHTNIVPVFEVGKDGEVSYYAMQFIQGQGLDLVIDELRRLKGRAHPSGPAREPEQSHLPIPSGTTAAAPSRSREISRMAQSLLTGRFVPGTPGGSGESEAATANRQATAALPDRLDSDETGAAPASDHSSGAVSTPPWAVVLPGGSQLSAVGSGRRLFFRSVAHIGRQVAAGMAYAHARGIIHRDIKPSNLLLDNEGVVWITDFGLAKASEDGLTRTGDILGTLRYMAPERFRGEGDARADIYALGLTLYELLILRPAFDSPDRLQLIERIKAEDPSRPREFDSRIPRDLETIVLKAINKDPKDRYASADALGEDLRRFLADEPIRARRVSVAERFSRWCKRNRVVAGLLGAVFLLLAAVAGVASVGYVRTKLALKREADQRTAAEKAEVRATREAKRAGTAEQEIRRQWYASTVNLMQPAWDTGKVGRLHALLVETEAYPDRGFEWYYWQRLCHLEQHTFIGHRDPVLSVSWSPDGTRLATGSWDGTAKVWDAASGRELLTVRGFGGQVFSVAFSPDGKLASGSWDGTAKIWDAAGGRGPLNFESHTGRVTCVSWSPDGKRLATASADDTARIWDAAGGGELLTLQGHTSPVHPIVWANGVLSVSWSPDGKRLATGSGDGTAKVWDAAGGPARLTLDARTLAVSSVSWSPDGKRLATGGWDGTAKVWDAAGGQLLLTLKGHTARVLAVSWSPDGKRLTTASDDSTAKVWDAADGRELLALKGHSSHVWSVSWSPDGRRLATASWDGTAKVWDAAGGRDPITLAGHAAEVWSVTWSPDGQRLETGGQRTKVWEAASGRKLLKLMRDEGVWSPDGTRLADGRADGTLKVWAAAGGRELFTVKAHTNRIDTVSWSPDGTRLATGSEDLAAKVWDAADGRQLFTLRGQTKRVGSVSWSPDGTRLATGSRDGSVMVWDAAGGQRLLTFEASTRWVWSVRWSPDGRRLATASDDGAKVWRAAGGGEPLTLEGHSGEVLSVAWSPDGTRLATGGIDSTAKVWDAVDGRELLTLAGHSGPVVSVAWSPDGTRLATGSADGSAKVWEAASAEVVQEWAEQDRAVRVLRGRNAITGPPPQGFLQTWLLLLPLPFAAGETGAQALDRSQLSGEAQVRPRAGERVLVGGRPFFWQEYRSPNAILNFHAVLGRVADRSVAYAVCYLDSDEARDGLWLQLGADDQAKVFLNGRQIYRVRLRWPLYAVDTVGPVKLNRGTNVLLFKVVNETEEWECCARLVDDAGRPAEGIRVKLTP